MESEDIKGENYKRYSGSRVDKLYPGRAKFLCNFPLPSIEMRGVYKFYWRIVGEDGAFPTKGGYGYFEITA